MTAPAKDSTKHGWSAAAAEQKAPEKKNPAVIWSNGKLIPWESATVHVSTHALHYGSSVFEGMRCYDTPKGPCLFRAKEHMRRFIDSGRVYRMQMLGLEELIEACKLVVRENGFKDAYLRPLAWRGAGPLGVNGSKLPIEKHRRDYRSSNAIQRHAHNHRNRSATVHPRRLYSSTHEHIADHSIRAAVGWVGNNRPACDMF